MCPSAPNCQCHATKGCDTTLHSPPAAPSPSRLEDTAPTPQNQMPRPISQAGSMSQAETISQVQQSPKVRRTEAQEVSNVLVCPFGDRYRRQQITDDLCPCTIRVVTRLQERVNSISQQLEQHEETRQRLDERLRRIRQEPSDIRIQVDPPPPYSRRASSSPPYSET
ncbi:hypothetical protein BDZ45DRAFT_447913 [Acephala macrosclerotiorum]|nr:hypothetical protein BDZ45DRAFT_447913 [Acephala macrosclerotiorum]